MRFRRRPDPGPVPDDEDPVATDLGRAQLAASSSIQNTVAVGGLGALLVAWLLTKLKQLATRNRA